MNFQPIQPIQSETQTEKSEGSSNDESSLSSKPVMSLAPPSISATAASNGRGLPVVYVKMPAQREILPHVSRSATIVPTFNSKISTAPSVSSPPMLISSASSASGSSTLAGNQPGFVTIQGSLRPVSQNVSTTSTLAPSQPHIITLPKAPSTTLLTNQQLITLQSASSSGQLGSGQQQQFVTIQGPLVAKTQGTSATLNPGQMQPHYVTIRTPVLATSGGKGAVTGSQPQFVTIQAPVLQSGGSAASTYLPVSAVGATTSGTKPVTYQVVKSSPKPREPHIVYPLPVANLLPSSQQKMVFTPVSVIPKLPAVHSGASVTVTSAADIVTSASSLSSGKVISSVGVVKTNSVSIVASKAIANVRGVIQAKPAQSSTQSLLKEAVSVLPSTETLVPTSQQMKISGSSLPTAVTVGASSVSSNSSQGFINITIANGHIQSSVVQEALPTVSEDQPTSIETPVASETEKMEKSPSVSTSTGSTDKLDEVTPVVTVHPAPTISEGAHEESSDSQSLDEIKALADEISIDSILKSNSVHYNDSINQKTGNEGAQSDKSEGEKDKLDLAKCLDSGTKEIESTASDQVSPQPTSPINLLCDDDITLVKLSPSDDPPPVAKFTVKMADDMDDDIKIELVREEETVSSKDKPENLQSHSDEQTPHTVAHKPLLLKNSSKLISTPKSRQSLIKNPASVQNMQSILVKSSKPRKFRLKSSSILKPQSSKPPTIKLEDTDGDTKDSLDTSMLSTDTEIKTENIDSPSTPTAFGDFDAIDALEWKNGIGSLPGSNLKFRMNEFGLMEIVSDDDEKSDKEKKDIDKDPSSPGSENLLIDEGSNSSLDSKSIKDKKGLDDIFCCEVCRVYGLASEFLNSRFCTQACSALYTVQQAWQYKREQDLRALRLRRKKRRLEQRLAREKEDHDGKDDTKPDLKKLKLEVPDDGSDFENSLDDSRIMDHSSSQFSVSGNLDDDCSLVGLADVNESDKKPRAPKASGNFTWSKYLEMVQARAAGVHLFKEPFNKFQKNGFKVSMKLECIDPQSPSVFCVASVAEVRGYRIRLHFDGYPDNYDFWANADSPDIFPARWCEKNNHRLFPPKGQTTFNWTSYLKSCKGVLAPKYLFPKSASVCSSQLFRVGMKLEAVDRKNSSLVCVSTVADTLDNRILIHFDSWDEIYDYWVEPSSPYIHPVGWCEKNGVPLTPPGHYKDASHFSWEKYLKETRAVPAPARAFKPRPPRAFKRGMRLEVVDKRVPHLIRVATVDDIDKYRIRIRFDGWPDDYSYWIDDDSPDIHYPGWCLETKHPLEPPLSEEDMRVLAKCGIPGCKGEGHIKGPKFSSHNSAQNCPYAPENIRKDSFLPDRLSGVQDGNHLDETLSKERRSSSRILGKKGWPMSQQDNLHSRRSGLSDEEEEGAPKSSIITSMQLRLQNELEHSVLEPGYKIETGASLSACWAKHSEPLQSTYINNASNPNSWSVQDVVDFLSTITCLEGYVKSFREQDIDGEAFLLLTQNELVSNMSLKLGHAITLYNCIVLLRQKCV